MTSDYDTEEDTELGSRVTRSCIDNYMRKPSLEDRAMSMISTMANNDLIMLLSGRDKPVLFDAAFVFVNHEEARFLISGESAAYYLKDGRLVRSSLPQGTAVIGSGLSYRAGLEPKFTLDGEKNAFLTASKSLNSVLTGEILEETLAESKTPGEWMEKLKALAGEKQFCAAAVFLPPRKKGFASFLLK